MVSHTINCDWVEWNLSAKLPHNYEGKDTLTFNANETTIIRSGDGNRFYKNAFKVFHRNKEFGFLLTNPRNVNLLPPENCQFKINNNKLYEKMWCDSAKEFMRNSALNYKSSMRVDIAIDGGNFIPVFRDWFDGKLDKVGRADVFPRMSGKRKINGYVIGNSKSKKKISCYIKTDELNKSNKWYIKDYWKRCGLPSDKPVERLELRFNNEENKKIKDMDWQKLDNFEHLADLFRTHSKGFFEFVKADSQKNITRKERIQPINWEAIGGNLLDKDSTRTSSAIGQGKTTMKTLHEIFYITKNKLYLDIAYEISINMQCTEWFRHMQPDWEKKIDKIQGHNKNGEIINNWITCYNTHHFNEQLVLGLKDSSYE